MQPVVSYIVYIFEIINIIDLDDSEQISESNFFGPFTLVNHLNEVYNCEVWYNCWEPANYTVSIGDSEVVC